MTDNKLTPNEPYSQEDMQLAFQKADHVVMRQYLKFLNLMPVTQVRVPEVKGLVRKGNEWVEQNRPLQASDQACFFKIGKLVYDSEENNLQKLTNVYSAAAAINTNVGLILYSNGKSIEMYMGVCGEPDSNRVRPSAEALYQYLVGNFQGSLDSYETACQDNDMLTNIVEKCFTKSNSVISSVSGVASIRSQEVDANAEFNQGLEKLMDTMRGKPFAALIIANAVSPAELADIRAEYELLYSSLVPFAKSSLTFSDTQSDGVTKTISDSLADTVGTNSSSALSVGTSQSQAHTEGHSTTHTDQIGVNASVFAGVNASAGINIFGLGASGGMNAGGSLGVNYSHSIARTKTFSDTTTFGKSETSTRTEGESKAHTITKTTSDGTTETISKGKSLQLTYENKTVASLLEKIDAQLERIKSSESFGMFASAAYFLAPNRALAEMAASSYKALISGTNTGLETAAVNTWDSSNGMEDVRKYLKLLWHPLFTLDEKNTVSPASLISAQELAVQMGLPKKSVTGVSVVEMAAFGRNIYKAAGAAQSGGQHLHLGSLYHMGQLERDASVSLDLESLSMHTFYPGPTGSGKSNTVFQILNELKKKKRTFLVIEPAKGEYKNIFGNMDGVSVYGTNPSKTELLRINPFRFPSDIHILEHLDRLVEIFNVAWPMYAAMPAVLKDAVERAYMSAGWDLKQSTNKYSEDLFPTFQDVLDQIQVVLQESAYSADNKSDYTGALMTRLKSLTNGLNGLIFCCDDIPDEDLFDKNVIVDLSRIGSVETKSLIMGLLVMKLQEYRMSCSDGIEKELEHVTVLEEAHNLLKRTSTEQSADSSNLAGKSVEMLANAIAEMRSYGEGFIIADQAPGLLDMAVIRNTNTKLILRLPDYSDRELVGRAIGLNDKQIQELSKLEKGVAAVYQNDWIEAVLCKVNHYQASESAYKKPAKKGRNVDALLKQTILNAIMKNELSRCVDKVDYQILRSSLPTQFKCRLYDYLASSDSTKLNELSKVVYAFFYTSDVMKRCEPGMSVGEIERIMEECLEPSLSEFSQTERDLVIYLLVHEQCNLDKGFLKLYESFSALMEGRIQVK